MVIYIRLLHSIYKCQTSFLKKSKKRILVQRPRVLRIYMYIYIYTHIHVYIYTYTHIYIYVYVYETALAKTI